MRILLFQIIFFLFTSPLFTQDASKNMHGFFIDLDSTCEHDCCPGFISGPVKFHALNKYAFADISFKMSYSYDISPVRYRLLIMSIINSLLSGEE